MLLSNKNNNRGNKKIYTLLLMLVLVVLFFCNVGHASAQTGILKYLDPTGGAIRLGVDIGSGKIGFPDIQNDFLRGVNKLLHYVFLFFSMLLGIAGLIFDWVINPQNVQNVLDRPAIYEMWKVVRDFLNLMFILVLLYSAFCTVFQIEKYHLKKILLTLVLMALLVNFSFPVSRMIIDASNITGYFLLNNVFPGVSEAESKSAKFVALTKITDVLVPKKEGVFDPSAPTTRIITAIVFVFILMITLMVIALMFMIRLVVLAVLIIFSPVGFVASAFPSTKNYADDWWKNLFKYALFFPIMVFMLAIAYRFMAELGMEESGAAYNAMLNQAQNHTGGDDPSHIASMAFFSIPIIILWVGLIVAQKTGVAGADLITNKAKGVANWAMRQPWRGTKRLVGAIGTATGVPGGLKQKYSNIVSKFKSGQAQREARVAARGPFKVAGAQQQDIMKRSEEYKKNHESPDSLELKASRGDAAAIYRLADDGVLNKETYDKFAAKNKNPGVQQFVNKKVKKNRIDILISSEVEAGKKISEAAKKGNTITKDQAKAEVADDLVGKMDAKQWNEQHWGKVLDPTDLKNYGIVHTAVDKALNSMAKGMTDEARIEVKKNLNSGNAGALRTNGLI